jgi:hypothetical protein
MCWVSVQLSVQVKYFLETGIVGSKKHLLLSVFGFGFGFSCQVADQRWGSNK